ncbi:serine/threonine-protein kinase [Actinomadura xylanilytica]|uniref:serine/threonine-protein kinase n=1 Tax=Actinomadura xylanilytica TaxID=887459 RepID=UPI00255B1E6F|nr:serine/threonine-protein kinase [Actinomadura xylanilytica]MDL4772589.1 serine/threonine-protein kinase [Actinomadura xylanilytica]
MSVGHPSPGPAERSSADDDPQVIGEHRLVGRLGAGGMGAVYLGEDPAGRQVAIKVIRRELALDDSFRARFAGEVANARRVASFCTARVLGHGEDDGRPYMVTEYIDGVSLGDLVERDGALDQARVRGLAIGIATALTAIHAVRLVHRDLKPGNVLLSATGPRVIDFGIARALDSPEKHTQTGFIVGSPGWIAPEQVFEGTVDTAADVFAWGTLVAYAATGAHPFGTGTMMVLASRAQQRKHDLDKVPDDLRPLVHSALTPSPAARPSAEELLVALVGAEDPEHTASRIITNEWAPVPAAASLASAASPASTRPPEASPATHPPPPRSASQTPAPAPASLVAPPPPAPPPSAPATTAPPSLSPPFPAPPPGRSRHAPPAGAHLAGPHTAPVLPGTRSGRQRKRYTLPVIIVVGVAATAGIAQTTALVMGGFLDAADKADQPREPRALSSLPDPCKLLGSAEQARIVPKAKSRAGKKAGDGIFPGKQTAYCLWTSPARNAKGQPTARKLTLRLTLVDKAAAGKELKAGSRRLTARVRESSGAGAVGAMDEIGSLPRSGFGTGKGSASTATMAGRHGNVLIEVGYKNPSVKPVKAGDPLLGPPYSPEDQRAPSVAWRVVNIAAKGLEGCDPCHTDPASSP